MSCEGDLGSDDAGESGVGEAPASGGRIRLRRARRDDVAVLVDCAGGPPAGRIRALRRLQKTLAADLYVLERGAELLGVVAIAYRRSLEHGGLVATVDALRPLGGAAGADAVVRGEVIALLADGAVGRAVRRGCVVIDCAPSDPEVQAALETRGFAPFAALRMLSLREHPRAMPATPARAKRGEP